MIQKINIEGLEYFRNKKRILPASFLKWRILISIYFLVAALCVASLRAQENNSPSSIVQSNSAVQKKKEKNPHLRFGRTLDSIRKRKLRISIYPNNRNPNRRFRHLHKRKHNSKSIQKNNPRLKSKYNRSLNNLKPKKKFRKKKTKNRKQKNKDPSSGSLQILITHTIRIARLRGTTNI